MPRLNRNTGMWEAYSPDGTRLGSFHDQASAAAAEGSGTANNTAAGSFGEAGATSATGSQGTGTVAAQARTPEQIAADRNAVAAQRPLPSGHMGSAVSGGASYNPNAQVRAYMAGNIGGTTGAYNQNNPAAQDAWRNSRNVGNTPGGFEAELDRLRNGPPGADAGSGLPPGAPGQQPMAPPGTPGQGQPGFATVDYSRYDQAASAYAQAENTFLAELDRLSGVDPFGNQAFLRKATDRAVAQARGTAAMTRGGPAAQAGAQRTAVGVQSQLAARGAEEQTIQRSRDEVAAGGLRAQAAAGLAGVAGDRANNEVELARLQTETMSTNLNAYLQKYGIDRQVNQSEVENLRLMALEMAKLRQDGQQFNEDLLLRKYGIDKEFAAKMKEIAEKENISTGEFIMGTIGAAGGILGGIGLGRK